MPWKADKPMQNTALQGISEQEKFMIRVLFICHGNICVIAWNACEINTLRKWQGEFTPVLPLIIIGLSDKEKSLSWMYRRRDFSLF